MEYIFFLKTMASILHPSKYSTIILYFSQSNAFFMQWSQKVSIETLQKFHNSFHSIFHKKRVTFFMTSFQVKKVMRLLWNQNQTIVHSSALSIVNWSNYSVQQNLPYPLLFVVTFLRDNFTFSNSKLPIELTTFISLSFQPNIIIKLS